MIHLVLLRSGNSEDYQVLKFTTHQYYKEYNSYT